MSHLVEFKAQVSEVSKDGSMTVRMMPFGVDTKRTDWWTGKSKQIQFDPGSLSFRNDVTPMTVDHGSQVGDRIGLLERHFEADDGLYGVMKFADTQLAQETRSLVKMGAVTDVSVGVLLDDEKEFQDDDKVSHLFGEIDHLAIVPHGQFAEAGEGSKVWRFTTIRSPLWVKRK